MGSISVADLQIVKVSEDSRGEIYAITLPGDRELMLLHSKAGTLRGGHSHDCPEIVLLLSGRMRYYKKLAGGRDGAKDAEVITVMTPEILLPPTAGFKLNGLSFNPADEIHMGEFLEDTWLIEWKIGTTKNGWSNTDYEPWRARVRASR